MSDTPDTDALRSIIGQAVAGTGADCGWSSPVTEGKATYSGAGEAEIAAAVELGAKAQADWAALPPLGRQMAMMEWADRIVADAEAIARLDTIDMGKPISIATQEAHIAAFILRFYASSIDKTGGLVAPSASHAMAVSTRRPYGIVGAIISWNYPAINAMMKIAPALAAGNAILLKPSSQAPRSALHMAALALETSVPTGLVSVLSGSSLAGKLMCRHPGVAMLAFTGSTAVGKLIAGIAAEKLVPSIIEAGGKNPILVCDDVHDLEGLARDAIAECYANTGQLCVARSKIIIPRALARDLTDALVAAADALRPGDARDPATHYGPLSSLKHAEDVASAIESGSAQARLVRDGRSADPLMQSMSLLAVDNPGSDLLRDEYFGPVLTIASYDRIEDGIAMANTGGYGLAATLWTTRIDRANALSQQIVAGHIKVKAQPDLDAGTGMALPVEPAGASGYGTEFGVAALGSYSRRQAVEYLGYGM
ncbi:aldehyde dehydrogenase [Ruegeria pomeroyi]|nr:aldehyde dehydrogenase [Ruegeria pomeroyi]